MKKTISLPAIALMGATLFTGIAHAQTTGAQTTGAMENGAMATGMMNPSATTSDADKQVLMDAAQGSVYDQATAELAVQKAQSKSVQRYALRLMDDHTRLNKMLLMEANKRGLVLPLTMTGDDQTKLQTLMNNAAGQDFDVAYLQEAIRINTDDVLKANKAVTASTDKDFRGLMSDYAKTEQKHLDSASEILSGLQKNTAAMKGDTMNTTPAMTGTTQGTTTTPTTPDTMTQ